MAIEIESGEGAFGEPRTHVYRVATAPRDESRIRQLMTQLAESDFTFDHTMRAALPEQTICVVESRPRVAVLQDRQLLAKSQVLGSKA